MASSSVVTPSHSPALDRLERALGRILRVGVLAAAVLLLAGLVPWMLGVERPVSQGLLHAGLIALMMTPVLRVVASLVGFARQGDRLFTFVALAVLAVLGATFWAATLQR